ncbi:MAG: hypothetical protein ABI766_12880 [Gemmatimonadales bacterium]
MTTPEQPAPAPAATAAAAMQAPTPNLVPFLVILGLLLVAAGAGVFLLLRPRLVFTNSLAAPIRVVAGDTPPRAMPPGGTVQLPGSFGKTLVVEWELVRPISADSAPMGEEMRGSIVVKGARGLVRASATTRPADGEYFAPLITNATSQPLRVMVNAGLVGAMDCGCAVRPGGERVFIGYYRLYLNSTVLVRGTSGATASFKDLGPQVTARDGTVGLRFNETDLRRVAAPSAR